MTTKEKILEEIKDINYAYNDCSKYNTIKNLLDEMEEERKKGKWEYPPTNGVRPFGFDTVYCTECGFFTVWDNNYNYCPHCGAFMKGINREEKTK